MATPLSQDLQRVSRFFAESKHLILRVIQSTDTAPSPMQLSIDGGRSLPSNTRHDQMPTADDLKKLTSVAAPRINLELKPGEVIIASRLPKMAVEDHVWSTLIRDSIETEFCTNLGRRAVVRGRVRDSVLTVSSTANRLTPVALPLWACQAINAADGQAFGPLLEAHIRAALSATELANANTELARTEARLAQVKAEMAQVETEAAHLRAKLVEVQGHDAAQTKNRRIIQHLLGDVQSLARDDLRVKDNCTCHGDTKPGLSDTITCQSKTCLYALAIDHPQYMRCPDNGCAICSLRDCPAGSSLHYQDGGCDRGCDMGCLI